MVRNTKRVCVACGNYDPQTSYFEIPKDEQTRKAWIKGCGIGEEFALAKQAAICQLHFTAESFTKGVRSRLKKLATPSISIDNTTLEFCRPAVSKKRRKNRCFACGKTNNYSQFRFPSQIELRQEWLRNLGLENIPVPSNETRVCSKHFRQCDIIGNQNATKRVSLRKGAVPISVTEVSDADNLTAQTMFHHDIVTEVNNLTRRSDTVEAACQTNFDLVNEVEVYESTSQPNTRDVACQVDVSNLNGGCAHVFNSCTTKTLHTDNLSSDTSNAVLVSPTPDWDISTPKSTPRNPHFGNTENSTDHIRTNVAKSCQELTPRKLRYVGDIRASDLSTPRRAMESFLLAKRKVYSQQKSIKNLKKQLDCAKKKVKTMGDLIEKMIVEKQILENTSHFLS